jgi:hypothetical protein
VTGTAPLAVAGWLWTSTTVLAALVTAALVAVLAAHVFATVLPRADDLVRRKLARAAIPLLACFVALAIVRFALILAGRPGP